MTYYPYEEDEAGKLRDTHKTGKKEEALLADDQIVMLAKEIVGNGAYLEAEELAKMLVGSKSEKDTARARLIEILPPPPKRPIYYLEHELTFLPRWTRDSMRYLGDFIDMLVKAAAYEKKGDKKIFNNSLGPAIQQFSRAYPSEAKLVSYLTRYNEFLYRDAKHDMTLPIGRNEHRFTSREVVLCLFITKEIADTITKLSNFAQLARSDKPLPIK